MENNFFKQLLKLKQTVFSFKELILRSKSKNINNLKSTINYYVKTNQLYHIRRGLYAKDKNYDRKELATKIFTPSYISFETVLLKAGIIFQYHKEIFIASYQTKTIECDGHIYNFKKLKPTILTDSIGIEIKEFYSIASPERAFLDTIYLYKQYYFDNLEPLDWEKVYEILPIYKDKTMTKRVNSYYEAYKNE